jgi:hypothetical protein
MAISLKPSDELIVAATSITLVYSVFAQSLPPLCDVRADTPANTNTHKTTKQAAITATAIVGSLSLLAKSKTVFVIGAGMILFETWKFHFANYGADGTKENALNNQQPAAY